MPGGPFLDHPEQLPINAPLTIIGRKDSFDLKMPVIVDRGDGLWI